MDKESEELGGNARFFTNGFSQYAWTKLLDKKLSGQERLDLYVQAITNMSKNPHIPQLFRDIFKGAFLPFRDPRTLTLFLKEINEFSYDHSEDLGNAFEYLLSILGSQGDAGQFRTPRHIIDFIVEVIDPKKNETILDPACGTAGFLISAYKHILEQNKEKALTPDEKTKLMNNIVGYDISPDMVKLSLVNMYLHGFQNPQIHEYDSLTSEKRWDESFDVIMANPPFMTPKGGIRPHKKFSIQANRAEVLFVDYIMEHLNINGRAGIIVPEGIIFKGDRAYKALRQKLVEDGLFAVVSLPAGVFQPYSGVKTSILLFDNQVAKKSKEMLFIKIENDGYDLGAQRRKIDKNDLPKALELIQKYKKSLDSKDIYLTVRDVRENNILLVSKNEIIESGDYNLTMDKYRKDPLEYLQNIINIKDIEKSLQPAIDSVNNFVKSSAFLQLQENLKKMTEQYQQLLENSQIKQVVALQKKFAEELKKQQKWPMVELGEVCEILDNLRKPVKKGDRKKGVYPYYGATGILDYVDKYLFDEKLVLVGEDGAKWGVGDKTAFIVDGKYWVNNHAHVLRPNREKLLDEFLVPILNSQDLSKYVTGITVPKLNQAKLKSIKIPLPPLEVQKEIVEKIEVKQRAIDAAREVIKNLQRERRYFGEELRKLDDVEWVELGNVCENLDSMRKPVTKLGRTNGQYPYYGASGIVDYVKDFIFDGDYLLISEDGANLLARSTPIAFSITGRVWVNNHAHILKFEEKTTQKLIELYINSIDISEYVSGAAQPKLNQKSLNSIKIPLPPLAIQKQLVAKAEEEEKIIEANKKLIEIMERKIEKVIEDI